MKHSILVLSSLFPSSAAPGNGPFIKERMFRVARHTNLVVVSPVPWFPGQGLIRLFRKDYRPQPPRVEEYDGIQVFHPRFLAVPGLFRSLDARMMYLGSLGLVRKLVSARQVGIIDSHFTYPDGLAATWLARKLGVKCTITLRGTEVPYSADTGRRRQLLQAWRQADRMFTVSDSLRTHAISLGAEPDKFTVIGNGIDTDKFRALDKGQAREALGLDKSARVLVTVGGLVERKGFHRVVECLPGLLAEFPDLVYLAVGGANAEGDYRDQIVARAQSLGVSERVRFLGALPPAELHVPLSAADVFVLSSSNEGWANVILESMACGTPVIATDVGGNAEVVNASDLGAIVPFGDREQLQGAIGQALKRNWSQERLTGHARDNHWDNRIGQILTEYDRLESTAREPIK